MAKTQKRKTSSISKKQSKGSTKKGNARTQSGSQKRAASDGSDDNADSSETECRGLHREHRERKKSKHAEPEVVDIEESDTPIVDEDSNDDEVRQCLHQTPNRTLTYCEIGWKWPRRMSRCRNSAKPECEETAHEGLADHFLRPC
jgi:hypothetical protein